MKRSNQNVAGPRVAAAALDMKTGRVKDDHKPAASVMAVSRTESIPSDPPAHVEDTEASLTEALADARQRNDFTEVCDRAEMMRQRLPDSEAGYRLGAIALREANRPEDAAALLAPTMRHVVRSTLCNVQKGRQRCPAENAHAAVPLQADKF